MQKCIIKNSYEGFTISYLNLTIIDFFFFMERSVYF